MTKKAVLLISISLITISTATAEVKKELHPYSKELQRAAGTILNSRFGSFDLDEEIFNALNRKECNLRIIDNNGVEVPFLIRTKTGKRTEKVQNNIPFQKHSFNNLADNRIEIVFKRNAEKQYRQRMVSSVTISSGLRNFEKQVSVWGSNDNKEWEALAENKPIFDYSRHIDIRNSHIGFSATDAKFIKLRISNISEKHKSPFTRFSRTLKNGSEVSSTESASFTRADFRIDNTTFYENILKSTSGRKIKRNYTAQNFSVQKNDKNSIVRFDTAGVPLNEIRLDISDSYFHRRYTLESSRDTRNWKTVQTGAISCIGGKPIDTEESGIRLSRSQRIKNWRLTIHNHDSPELDIKTIKISGEVREAVFYCDREKSYRLIYGSLEGHPPVYDIDRVVSRAKDKTFSEYKVGPQKNNPAYNTRARPVFFLSRRTIMTLSVLIMMIVLVWIIARTVKHIE